MYDRLLKTLAEQNKDKDLIVRYVLGGYKDSEGDTVRLQRFIIVDEEDVEKEKAYFSELVSCVIKSIQLKTEDTVEQFCSPYSEQDDLLERLQG